MVRVAGSGPALLGAGVGAALPPTSLTNSVAPPPSEADFADKAPAVLAKLWQVLFDMYFFRRFQLPADPGQHCREGLLRKRERRKGLWKKKKRRKKRKVLQSH